MATAHKKSFEIAVAYVVGVVYNDIHESARLAVGKKGALDDEYRRQAKAYMLGVKTDQQGYDQTAADLHKYFGKFKDFVGNTYPQFVNKFVECFVPNEYFVLMKPQTKDETMQNIICDLVAGMVAHASEPETLRSIVDTPHAGAPAQAVARELQDFGVAILDNKRSEIHAKFMHKVGQVRNSAPSGVLDQLKARLKQEVEKNIALEARATRAEAELRQARDAFHKQQQYVDKARQMILMVGAGRGVVSRENATTALSARQGFRQPPQDTRAEYTEEDDNDPLDGPPRGPHEHKMFPEDAPQRALAPREAPRREVRHETSPREVRYETPREPPRRNEAVPEDEPRRADVPNGHVARPDPERARKNDVTPSAPPPEDEDDIGGAVDMGIWNK